MPTGAKWIWSIRCTYTVQNQCGFKGNTTGSQPFAGVRLSLVQGGDRPSPSEAPGPPQRARGSLSSLGVGWAKQDTRRKPHGFCLNGLDAPFVDTCSSPCWSFFSTLLVLVQPSTIVKPQKPHPNRFLDFGVAFFWSCDKGRPEVLKWFVTDVWKTEKRDEWEKRHVISEIPTHPSPQNSLQALLKGTEILSPPSHTANSDWHTSRAKMRFRVTHVSNRVVQQKTTLR